jgi:hypothetical protein
MAKKALPKSASEAAPPEDVKTDPNTPMSEVATPVGTPLDPAFFEAGAPPVPTQLCAYEYTHTVCGTEGAMDNRTYYLWYCYPWLVTGLFCTKCNAAIRIGEDGEMEWSDGSGKCILPDDVPMTSVPVPDSIGFFNQLNPLWPSPGEHPPEGEPVVAPAGATTQTKVEDPAKAQAQDELAKAEADKK